MPTQIIKVLVTLLFMAPWVVSAQNLRTIDSLKTALKTTTDTTKVKLLMALSEDYRKTNPDSALYYGEQVLLLSQQLGYQKGIVEGLSKKGVAYEYKGEYQQALQLYTEALEIAKTKDIQQVIHPVYTNIALVNKALGDFPKALAYNFKALELSEQTRDSADMAVSLNNIGNLYSFRDNFDEGLKYYLQAAELFEKLDEKKRLASILNNIGIIYSYQGKFEKSLAYHERSLKLKQELDNTNGVAASLNNIGNLMRDQEKYEEAKDYLLEALAIYKKTENQHKLPIIYRDLAEVYTKLEVNQALQYADSGLAQAEAIGKKNDIKEAYQVLAKIYARQNNYEKAFQFHQKYTSLKDSLFNEKKSQQVAELQTQYQTAKKEKEIALLEEEKAQQRLWSFLTLGGLGIALLLGILLTTWQRTKMRKNREVHWARQAQTEAELENAHLKENELQRELDFKHKELTSHTLNLVQKNSTMEELKENINTLIKRDNKLETKELKELGKLVDYSFNLDKDWEEFSMYFEQVHKNFFTNLLEAYPGLTTSECRLCALIKLNLTIKETATILRISPSSVKMARYRLRKKLRLCHEENLTEFIINFDKEAIADARNANV